MGTNMKAKLNQVGQQVNEDQNERKHVNLKAMVPQIYHYLAEISHYR